MQLQKNIVNGEVQGITNEYGQDLSRADREESNSSIEVSVELKEAKKGVNIRYQKSKGTTDTRLSNIPIVSGSQQSNNQLSDFGDDGDTIIHSRVDELIADGDHFGALKELHPELYLLIN